MAERKWVGPVCANLRLEFIEGSRQTVVVLALDPRRDVDVLSNECRALHVRGGATDDDAVDAVPRDHLQDQLGLKVDLVSRHVVPPRSWPEVISPALRPGSAGRAACPRECLGLP